MVLFKTNNFKSTIFQYKGLQRSQINAIFYKPNISHTRGGQYTVFRLVTHIPFLVTIKKSKGFANGLLYVFGLEKTTMIQYKNGNTKICLTRRHTSCIDYNTYNFRGGQSTPNVPHIMVCIRHCNQSSRANSMP